MRFSTILHSAVSLSLVLTVGQCVFTTGAVAQGQPEPTGKLVITDDFQRSSLVDDQHSWVTNDQRAKRTSKQDAATFQPQVQLVDGIMRVVRTEGSDHAATARLSGRFGDAVCRVKFRLQAGDKFSFNFNDPGLKKTVHAGHVCKVEISTSQLTLQDQMNGTMDLKIRQMRLEDPKSPQVARRTEATTKRFKTKVAPDQWHALEIRIRGPILTVSIDGQERGSFESPGFGHPTKENIAFSVPRRLEVDELRVWALASEE